jgi:hypothetical protein
MKLLIAFVVPSALAAASLFASTSGAAAQNHPYCYQHGSINGGGSLECSFLNMRQCLETASGRGGTCMANPAWTPLFAQPKRGAARH